MATEIHQKMVDAFTDSESVAEAAEKYGVTASTLNANAKRLYVNADGSPMTGKDFLNAVNSGNVPEPTVAEGTTTGTPRRRASKAPVSFKDRIKQEALEAAEGLSHDVSRRAEEILDAIERFQSNREAAIEAYQEVAEFAEERGFADEMPELEVTEDVPEEIVSSVREWLGVPETVSNAGEPVSEGTEQEAEQPTA